VNIVEEYSYDMPQNGGVEAKLSVQGPAGPLFTWHDAQGGLAGGVPPWTGGSSGACLEVVARAIPVARAVAPAYDAPACPMGWYREITKIIDVSSLTQSGPIQLQVRPFASKDAFYCTMSLLVAVFADVEFTLTQTPKGFRPEDARDDPATSKCSGNSGDNCRPSFTVRLKETSNGPWWPADLHVTYDFVLDHPSVLAGQPVTAWLKGSSTNSDGPRNTPDDASYPDYIFEAQGDAQLGAPDRNGLHVATANDIDYSNASGNAPGGEDQTIDITVTSRDYGGSAILRPTVTITGAGLVKPEKAKFNIVDQGNDVVPPDPGCVAADEFVKHPYASLPVDQDCNGIADSWEASHGGPYPDPRADDDRDGFAVFDEYRGFHQINPDNPNGPALWSWTDPAKRDLFYWDAGGLTTNSMGIEDGWTHGCQGTCNHLANVFGSETGALLTLHKLNARQARASNSTDPAQKVNALNSNSPFIDSDGPQGFAAVYMRDDLSGTRGENDGPTLGESCPDSAAGDASCYRNDGVYPIRIDLNGIQSEADAILQGNKINPNAYMSVLLDEVLAHETGHKLTLQHHARIATRSPLTSGKHLPGNLLFGQFFQRDSWELYIEEFVYKLSKQNGFTPLTLLEDQPPIGCGGLSYQRPYGAPSGPGARGLSAQKIADFAKAPQWPIRYGAGQMMSEIGILTQDGTIMSHTPRLDYTSSSQWHFLPGETGAMCLLPDACGKAPVGEPNCE
jgi:hypothetical protein